MIEGGQRSLRSTVVVAACVIAVMTVVAGAVSWSFYARLESLLVSVANEQSSALAQAIRLAETSNRYAAGGGEIEAARNQLQRQNATVALAQHAQALYEVMATLRRNRLTAEALPAIERQVVALEDNLYRQNELVERRIDLEARLRRARAEARRLQGEFDAFLAALTRAESPLAWTLDPAAARIMARLHEAGQADQTTALDEAREDLRHARLRFTEAASAWPEGAGEALAVARLTGIVDHLSQGEGDVFAARASLLETLGQLSRATVAGRETVTRLGIAVSRLLSIVEVEAERTKAAAAEQIEEGRRWLMAVAAATFLGPVLLIWLAVNRIIVAPLARLADATRAIAAGDLQTPIPPNRHWEFHEIAEALAVFRDNTAALAERSEELTMSENAHRHAREQAERALDELRETEEQLIQSEKMAALGSVVAGVAHEVNTPLGITLTAASLLGDELVEMGRMLAANRLRRGDFEQFLARAGEIAALIQGNMERAAELVQAFKQVAADQSSESRRVFPLKETLEQTLTSVRPACDKAGVAVELDCPPDIAVDSYPGALSQVVTVLIMNSLDHAFSPGAQGTIAIRVTSRPDGELRLDYRDNGRGIPGELHRRVFEPFFTTKRSGGNTGLGLHIAFNVAQRSLGGRLEVAADADQGAHFVLRLPAVTTAEAQDGNQP